MIGRSFVLAMFGLVAACGGSQPEAVESGEGLTNGAAPEVASAGAETRTEDAWDGTGEWPDAGVERLRVAAGDGPAVGAEEPLVTIVVFSDFQCPFCARVVPTIDRVLETYPDSVRVVFRDNPLPFHQDAMPAAEAAMEAYRQQGDEGFWAMHDLLFENQRALSRSDLEQYARRLDLDLDAFRQALDDGRHREAIEADQGLARRLGATGTPSFFLNGRLLRGAQPFTAFEAIVDQEIALAERAMESGVARRHLYAAAMADAREEPPPREPARPSPSPSRPTEPPGDTIYAVPVDGSPTRGPDDALVTIVEFVDMECPFCARVQPTLEAIRERYGDDVRFVFKHNPLPFHDGAKPAAIALEEARAQGGEEAFWALHDRLWESLPDLEREELEAHAEAVGLNVRRFRRALDREAHTDEIDADQALARRVGARGTPSFFINGRKFVGAQPLERFTAVIDEAREEARAMVREGTPRSRLYATIIEDGLEDVEAWREAQENPSYNLAVPSNAPTLGPDHAPVTIQIFTDFECPFCKRVQPTLEQLREAYPEQVRFVFRHYPLPMHPHAQLAHEAAIEVHAQGGNDAFWAYHDLLFERQDALERDDLERYAESLGGVDMRRFRRALDQRTHRATVEADQETIREAGARIGTPSFFVEGELVQGAQPYARFRDAVEGALDGGAEDVAE